MRKIAIVPIARQVVFTLWVEVQALIAEFAVWELLAGADRMRKLAVVAFAARRIVLAAIG